MKRFHLIVIFIVLSIASLLIGTENLSWQVFSWKQADWYVFWTSRFPRFISIIIAGAGISISGTIMQGLTQNRFVSPTTAGTMDAARLGILVALLLFTEAPIMIKMLIAFLFALAGSFVFMKLLDYTQVKETIFVPLIGLMFGNILGAITTFFAIKFDLVQNISAWLQGDFSMVIKGRYEMLYFVIPVFLVAYFYAGHFTISGMGESFASNLGLSYKAIMRTGLVIVSFITASVVLTVGMIPFLGLIVPNIISIYRGDHIRKNLPDIALFGVIFLLICDILGRLVIYPYEISISLMVGIIGSALFIWLLLRRKIYA